MKRVSVIVPSFNEERNISVLIAELQKVFNKLSYSFECIIVDDGSKDNTLNEVKTIAAIHHNIHYIELSRNFGKDYALQAGLRQATGDAVITIDADLQHPPQMISKLTECWERGYDIAYAYRDQSNAHAKGYQKFTSKLFYKVINSLSNIQLEDGISDFRLLDRMVVDQLNQMNEYEMFFRGMVKWVGFRQIGIPYVPEVRLYGEASYSFIKLLKLAMNSMMAFSVRPLYITTAIGLVFSFASLFYIPYIIISYAVGAAVSGWASLIATIAFFGGLQLFVLGIIGMYLGKLFMQSKQRPNYIIRSSNLNKKEHATVEF